VLYFYVGDENMGIRTGSGIRIVRRGTSSPIAATAISSMISSDTEFRAQRMDQLFREYPQIGVALINRLYAEFYPGGSPSSKWSPASIAISAQIQEPVPHNGSRSTSHTFNYPMDRTMLLRLGRNLRRIPQGKKSIAGTSKLDIPLTPRVRLVADFPSEERQLAGDRILLGLQLRETLGEHVSWLTVGIDKYLEIYYDQKQLASEMYRKLSRLLYYMLLEDQKLLEVFLRNAKEMSN
jgi:hypothetical protein